MRVCYSKDGAWQYTSALGLRPISSDGLVAWCLSVGGNRERAEDLEAQVKERDVLVEELVLSNQAQLERNETLTVQNEDLRGEFNEAVR